MNPTMPLSAYTLGDYSGIPCPYCATTIRPESEDVKDGNVIDCPRCERSVRLGVDYHVTIRAYPEPPQAPQPSRGRIVRLVKS